MRMYDLIEKKRNGGILGPDEITWMIDGFVKGSIPDYQMSAMLMAIYFRGMTDEETSVLTAAVAHSGDMADLSGIDGIKVDKHSTGGVGDKTTLIVAPVVSACGVKVAKMSGRGLGHTGGTVDKLEAIPGMKTALTREEFFRTVNETGLSVIGQSGNLAPADKKLYALRDVTATVDSIPLIAASIMSKKLAAGNDCILLDVKTGSGAFMKTPDESIALAQKMVAIGENAGKRTAALITDMDIPLGNYIGNTLEVIEAVDTLNGKGPEDLTNVCLSLAENMLYLAGKGTLSDCRQMAQEAIDSGRALDRLIAMVEAQGGDSGVIKDTGRFQRAPYSMEVCADADGYVTAIDTKSCGIASVMLGAGRETVDSIIDFSAGIALKRKLGDMVEKGDVLAVLYASDETLFPAAAKRFKEAYTIGARRGELRPLIFARVEKEKTERFVKGDKMESLEMLKYVDHTQLEAYAVWEDIRKLCEEAIAYRTASVCIPPCYVKRVKDTYGDKINICTVVGFPLGYSVTEAKAAEVKQALRDGANEIDMVVNVSDVKNGHYAKAEHEIRKIKKAAGDHILKVIIETCYLTEEEKIAMCHAVTNAGADYIKTSTGFGTGGAVLEDILLFKKHIGPDVKIKAAGGVRTISDLETFILAGCSRIGTSSAINIINNIETNQY